MDVKYLLNRIDDYLLWSYGYYELDKSLASDNMYDTCCLILLRNYSKTPDWFKKFVSKEDLRAGTGFALEWKSLPEKVLKAIIKKAKQTEEWNPEHV